MCHKVVIQSVIGIHFNKSVVHHFYAVPSCNGVERCNVMSHTSVHV